MTPSILRRWPAITGTTKRSLRMVTNSSCSTPSSRWARRNRSSDSWMFFFWRSMSRRRRPRATLAWSATLPSGRILPFSSRSRERNSPMAAARRGPVQQGEQLEDFLGLEPRAFDAQFVHRRFHVGDAAELDAQGSAATTGLRVEGGVQVLNRLSCLGERGVELHAVGKRAHLFQFALAQGARDVAAEKLPQGFGLEEV